MKPVKKTVRLRETGARGVSKRGSLSVDIEAPLPTPPSVMRRAATKEITKYLIDLLEAGVNWKAEGFVDSDVAAAIEELQSRDTDLAKQFLGAHGLAHR